jgi:Restriction endonuclease
MALMPSLDRTWRCKGGGGVRLVGHDGVVADLSLLSSLEFEELCRDLLAAELGVRVESFAAGPDGGVDLRWTAASGCRSVGQCKHYAKSGFDALMRSLREQELAKVRSLAPEEYWVATSVEMTPDRKEKVYRLFQEWMPGPDRVLGAHDIDGLLRRHPQVLHHNLKLLLGDSERLATFLHSDVFNRTVDRVERINESLPVYVVTDAHQQARSVLAEHRVCIVSGEPGAGKSTLAQMLVAEAVHDGYDLIDIGDGIANGWGMLRSSTKQVFFYDDFLGELRFDWLGRDLSDVVRFIERVARSRSTLLVMTTREYILRDAARVREKLGRLDPRYRFLLDVGQLSPDLAARILFNHLWHAGLPAASLVAIAAEDFSPVVHHSAFNPRVIETCTRPAWVGDGAGYADRLCNALDHPDDLWENAYTEYLDDSTRLLLHCIALPSGHIDSSQLFNFYEQLIGAAIGRSSDVGFNHGLAILEESFILVHRDADRRPLWAAPRNPSIRSFVMRKLCRNRGLLRTVLSSADDVWLLRAIPEEYMADALAGIVGDEGIRRDFAGAVVRIGEAPADPGEMLYFTSSLPDGWGPERSWLEDIVNRYIQQLKKARWCDLPWGNAWEIVLAFTGDPLGLRLHQAADEYLSPLHKIEYFEGDWSDLAEHLQRCREADVECYLDLNLIEDAFECFAQMLLLADGEHADAAYSSLTAPLDLSFSVIDVTDPEGCVDRLGRELGVVVPDPNQLPLFEIPESWKVVRAFGFERELDGARHFRHAAMRIRELFSRLLDQHNDGYVAIPAGSIGPISLPLHLT